MERVSKQRHPSARMHITSMGDTMVGKSCLIKRYCEDRFLGEYVPTIGIDYGVKAFKTDIEDVNFWDIGGDDVYFDIRNEFYKDTHGVMIVYDVNDRRTFDNIEKWIKEYRDFSSDKSDMVLVGNKVDKRDRKVPYDEGAKKALTIGAKFYELSALGGEGIDEMFESLFIRILEHRFDVSREPDIVPELPSSKTTEKDESEVFEMSSRSKDFIAEDISVNYSERKEVHSDKYSEISKSEKS